MYHYTDGGLRNVWLANGYEIKQTPFGESVVFHDLEGLTRSICMALTRKPSLLTGVEFRYIRSAGMLLSQPALGKLMGIDGQSVARWEKTSRVPRWADKLVRLLYTARAEGNEPIAKAVERLQTVERLVKQKIVVRAANGRWKPNFETMDEDEVSKNVSVQRSSQATA
jgi:DNA-binding transcriptional regulator YiaG